MSKLTVLEIVNNTLMALGCNQVSDVSESLDSENVLKIAKECYYEMMAQGDWPHLEKLLQFNSLADSDRPNYLEIPSNVKHVHSFMYNNNNLKYLDPDEFIKLSIDRDISKDNVVEVVDHSGYTFHIIDDKDPEYYTILEETYIVCDSHNKDVDSVLQASKTIAKVSITPSWTEENNFVPNLTENMFPTYLSLVKRAAFLYIRREASPKDERQAVAGLGRLYRKEFKLDFENPIKNYGR